MYRCRPVIMFLIMVMMIMFIIMTIMIIIIIIPIRNRRHIPEPSKTLTKTSGHIITKKFIYLINPLFHLFNKYMVPQFMKDLGCIN